jgi:hypothetical protein
LVRYLLFLAASAVGVAATGADSQDLLRGLNSPWVSGWALADFDGDSQIDVATASAGHRDARGYAHEVSVNLKGVQSSFLFRSRDAKVQLRARDMDGDHDRDIVIFETPSMEPVGIWLNDGSGHFQEGDLADFQAALGNRDPASFECPRPAAVCWLAMSEQRIQLTTPRVSIAPQDRVTEALPSEREHLPTDSLRSDLRSRAPPSTL